MARTLLLTADQMNELDARTIDALGLAASTLMESAAGACVQVACAEFSAELELGAVVVCGTGNNGGDGLAIARRLAGIGVDVEVVLLGTKEKLGDAALKQWELARALGVVVRDAPSEEPLAFATRSWRRKGLLVDAIFGTGLTRTVQKTQAAAISAIAAARGVGVAVLSVDLPSGIDATTGVVHGVAVRADRTVTFASPKLGHFLQPGRQYVGELTCADIGIPVRHWLDVSSAAAHLSDETDLIGAVPPSVQDTHKGTYGHLLVVAGSEGKVGAARLCVDAALRAGAGLVTLAVPEGLDVSGLVAEAMVERIPKESWKASTLLELLESRDALAIGPGLGLSPETVFLCRQLFAEAPVPAVFDADALGALVAAPPDQMNPADQRVLTPHPGEFSRLMNSDWPNLAPRRVTAAREIAARLTSTVVLKGASSLIVDPEGHVCVNSTGNPGMSTAGSGDVLTGVIGALLGRGSNGPEAARAGAWWHGMAGDIAAATLGEPSLVAGDIVDHLGHAWREAMSGEKVSSLTYFPDLFGQ